MFAGCAPLQGIDAQVSQIHTHNHCAHGLSVSALGHVPHLYARMRVHYAITLKLTRMHIRLGEHWQPQAQKHRKPIRTNKYICNITLYHRPPHTHTKSHIQAHAHAYMLPRPTPLHTSISTRDQTRPGLDNVNLVPVLYLYTDDHAIGSAC
jgi:hypothetical protein